MLGVPNKADLCSIDKVYFTSSWLIYSLNFNEIELSAPITTRMTLTLFSGILHNLAISTFMSEQLLIYFYLLYCYNLVSRCSHINFLASIFSCVEDDYIWSLVFNNSYSQIIFGLHSPSITFNGTCYYYYYYSLHLCTRSIW